ncbi:phage holin family protein [Nocardioides panacisoli]|uniref:phage holin family protein n=1 Tax=Nocardioides panacisoli TaxID=627624 RepID=UPI001C6383ED|nr:phage holin family protein [Nocardioides panacisoli]QYJ04827.1 phage holin family protein [Nocardioides panacisoli]
MLRRIAMHWVLLAVVLAAVAAVSEGVEVSGGVLGLAVAAAVVGLVNAVVGPVLRLLTAPITLVTLGLFSLVLNGLLLALSAWLTDALSVGGPVRTVVAAVAISVVNAVLGKLVLD